MGWNEIGPDPLMASEAEVKFGKWAPDMALYHCDDIHYDLLVKNESRIALLGLLAGKKDESSSENKEVDEKDDAWVKVTKKGKEIPEEEKLISDEILTETDDDVADELSEEIILHESKLQGHIRTGPQVPAESVENSTKYNCERCKKVLESKGLLDAHMVSHNKSVDFTCDSCDDKFSSLLLLKEHISALHGNGKITEEWNYNDCHFQAIRPAELMIHLKLTSHQPSQCIKDRKVLFKDYKQCYTCKLEFDGFWNLMTHRKSAHPSNKKCRNYPESCTFGSECWYVHVEDMDVVVESEQRAPSFKCFQCDNEFEKKPLFMQHKKKMHQEKVKPCQRFDNGDCPRSKEECWYQHSQSESSEKQVFPQAQTNPIPPDQVMNMAEMLLKLHRTVENLELKLNTIVEKNQ